MFAAGLDGTLIPARRPARHAHYIYWGIAAASRLRFSRGGVSTKAAILQLKRAGKRHHGDVTVASLPKASPTPPLLVTISVVAYFSTPNTALMRRIQHWCESPVQRAQIRSIMWRPCVARHCSLRMEANLTKIPADVWLVDCN